MLSKALAVRPRRETQHRLCDRCDPKESTFPTVTPLTRFNKRVEERPEVLPWMSVPTHANTWIIVGASVSLGGPVFGRAVF